MWSNVDIQWYRLFDSLWTGGINTRCSHVLEGEDEKLIEMEMIGSFSGMDYRIGIDGLGIVAFDSNVVKISKRTKKINVSC